MTVEQLQQHLTRLCSEGHGDARVRFTVMGLDVPVLCGQMDGGVLFLAEGGLPARDF